MIAGTFSLLFTITITTFCWLNKIKMLYLFSTFPSTDVIICWYIQKQTWAQLLNDMTKLFSVSFLKKLTFSVRRTLAQAWKAHDTSQQKPHQHRLVPKLPVKSIIHLQSPFWYFTIHETLQQVESKTSMCRVHGRTCVCRGWRRNKKSCRSGCCEWEIYKFEVISFLLCSFSYIQETRNFLSYGDTIQNYV